MSRASRDASEVMMTAAEPTSTGAVAPPALREMNQRLLLDRLLAAGPATRPQLARDTGLSLPTVIAALGDLERAGLVRPAGRAGAAPGRPATLFEVDPGAGHVVAVDIGRSWLRLVVADLLGTELSGLDVPNTAPRTSTALVGRVQAAVAEAIRAAGIDPAAVTHTVIGSPGVYDADRKRVRYAVNLPGWQRAGLAETLAQRLGSSLTVDNDANLAAIGEHSYGAAHGARHFAYLHIGTGVGMGLVLDGQLYQGHSGAAGEVGYLPLGPASGTVGSGRRRGLLESSLAADAVVRYATGRGMPRGTSAEAVFAAARAGDQAALGAVAETAGHLARLAASIAAFLDPELIVVGGGVGQNLDLLAPYVQAELESLTPMRPRLVAGALGSRAVVRGAVAVGLRRARDIVFAERRDRAG